MGPEIPPYGGYDGRWTPYPPYGHPGGGPGQGAARPAEGGRKHRRGRRRAIEAGVLVVLLPAFLVPKWMDVSEQATKHWKPREHVTTVRYGGTGTLGHARWRLLRRAPGAHKEPSGGVRFTILMRVTALNAEGVKDAKAAGYRVRDDAGHVWSAVGLFDDELRPGGTRLLKVSATVPARLVESVVLEVRPGKSRQPSTGAVPVLRFEHRPAPPPG